VKEIALEVRYADMSEDRVKKMREILEEHQGEVPLSVTIVDFPDSAGAAVRMKISQHFKVKPGPELTAALDGISAKAQYLFERTNHAA